MGKDKEEEIEEIKKMAKTDIKKLIEKVDQKIVKQKEMATEDIKQAKAFVVITKNEEPHFKTVEAMLLTQNEAINMIRILTKIQMQLWESIKLTNKFLEETQENKKESEPNGRGIS